MDWLLIARDDVQRIRKALSTLPNVAAREALHLLDTGLHTTDAVPDDWRDDEAKPAEAHEGQ
jgi:hypothetical protein